MGVKYQKFSLSFLITDFLLLSISYFGMNYLKRATLGLSLPYLKLLLAFYLFWFLFSLWTGKFFLKNYKNYKRGLLLIIKNNLFILYAVSFMVVIMGLTAFSRLHIFGTIALFTLLQGVHFSLYYLRGGREIIQSLNGQAKELPGEGRISLVLLSADFLLLNVAFFLLNYYKRTGLWLNPGYGKLLIVIYGLWLLAGLFTRKFERRTYPNFYYAFAPYLKSFLLLMATMAVLLFALRQFRYSRLQVFGTFSLLLIFEIFLNAAYLLIGKRVKRNGDVETIESMKEVMQQENLQLRARNGKNRQDKPVVSVAGKLREQYLKLNPEVYQFIEKNIDLSQIDVGETLVLNTHTPFNIENIEGNSLDLFVNLHRVNDFRYINRYFLEVHKKFFNGGYFVGRADTIATHRKMFFKKYPEPMARIFYLFNFIFVRILPKLPGIKKFYFVVTRGKNRVISKAELLGRLYFCGFKVLAVEEIGFSLFYIAQKVKTPSIDRNPSYSPVIKLRRVGLNGDIMYVYKLRTMHPYSEYLQEYIYENYNLQDNGKFKNDFRMTEWGKVFRKLWIDELPQLVNYFRGDLNLVGVRALSQHYFQLYPEDIRELRTQVKPGLVPPYYADMPNSFEEIIESERIYLKQKLERPFITDMRYFGKAMFNIIFRHARSR